MRSLLKLANASDACKLGYREGERVQVRLTRDEAAPSVQKLWKAVLAAIDKRETPDLTDILVAYGLDPPHSAVRLCPRGCWSISRPNPRRPRRAARRCRSPLQ